MSKADDQDTAPQIEALEAAGCQRIYEERVSAGRWDSPELHRLLMLDKVEKAGAGFRSLTENIDSTTASGRMMMQMLGAFAEFERAMVRENGPRRASAQRAPRAATAAGNPSSRPSSKPKCSPC